MWALFTATPSAVNVIQTKFMHCIMQAEKDLEENRLTISTLCSYVHHLRLSASLFEVSY